jgi:hypothetical protein
LTRDAGAYATVAGRNGVVLALVDRTDVVVARLFEASDRLDRFDCVLG